MTLFINYFVLTCFVLCVRIIMSISNCSWNKVHMICHCVDSHVVVSLSGHVARQAARIKCFSYSCRYSNVSETCRTSNVINVKRKWDPKQTDSSVLEMREVAHSSFEYVYAFSKRAHRECT
jgi:hypothetical protein